MAKPCSAHTPTAMRRYRTKPAAPSPAAPLALRVPQGPGAPQPCRKAAERPPQGRRRWRCAGSRDALPTCRGSPESRRPQLERCRGRSLGRRQPRAHPAGGPGGAGPLGGTGAWAGAAPRRLVPALAPAPPPALPGSRTGGGTAARRGNHVRPPPERHLKGRTTKRRMGEEQRRTTGRNTPAHGGTRPASSLSQGPAENKRTDVKTNRGRRRLAGDDRSGARGLSGAPAPPAGGWYVAVEEAPPAANPARALDAVTRYSKTIRQPTMPRAAASITSSHKAPRRP